MTERRRVVSCLWGAGLAACLAACGGGGSSPTTTPTPAPTPTPCTQNTIVQESGGISGRTLVYDDFSVPDSGRLDVTLDWTDPASLIGFYVVPANTCTLNEFNSRTCNFLITSETTTKPRKISSSNFSAGNYRWMVANYSEAQESVSLLIVLSKGSCPALGGMPSASQRTDESWPVLERALHR